MSSRFLDFDLQLERTADGFKAEVLDSPGGEGSESFTFSKSDEQEQLLLLRLGRTRSGTRSSLTSDQRQAAEEMGSYLYDTVFSGAVREKFRTSLAIASGDDSGLRLRLRLGGDPELLDLPWEYLFDTVTGQFLVLDDRTPVVRYPMVPTASKHLEVTLPLKILVAISAAVPPGAAQLDVEHEWNLLDQQALGEAQRRGIIALRRVSGSLSEITEALRHVDYHVFHYIGHSGYTPTGEGLLAFEGEGGTSVLRPGNDLAQILGPKKQLGLAVFNSCEGARESATDPFAGVAQSLLKKGVPAVVGMQFEITDEAAILFSKSFYSAIAEGEPVDAAVSSARQAIFTSDNDVEWGTPVLFLRAADANIFQRNELDQEEMGRLGDLAARYREARTAMDESRWSDATTTLESIAATNPDYVDTARLLETARRKAGEPQRLSRDEEDEEHDGPQWVGIFVAVLLVVIVIVVVVSIINS